MSGSFEAHLLSEGLVAEADSCRKSSNVAKERLPAVPQERAAGAFCPVTPFMLLRRQFFPSGLGV